MTELIGDEGKKEEKTAGKTTGAAARWLGAEATEELLRTKLSVGNL